MSALLTELSTAVAFFAFRVLQDSSLALFRLGENYGVVSMFRDDSYIFPPPKIVVRPQKPFGLVCVGFSIVRIFSAAVSQDGAHG